MSSFTYLNFYDENNSTGRKIMKIYLIIRRIMVGPINFCIVRKIPMYKAGLCIYIFVNMFIHAVYFHSLSFARKKIRCAFQCQTMSNLDFVLT